MEKSREHVWSSEDRATFDRAIGQMEVALNLILSVAPTNIIVDVVGEAIGEVREERDRRS